MFCGPPLDVFGLMEATSNVIFAASGVGVCASSRRTVHTAVRRIQTSSWSDVIQPVPDPSRPGIDLLLPNIFSISHSRASADRFTTVTAHWRSVVSMAVARNHAERVPDSC